MLLLAGAGATARAAALSADEQHCLSCHGMQGLQMPLTDGSILSLYVSGDHFADSVHGPLGCTACHTDINPATHPQQVKPIASARAFSIERSQVCATCHVEPAHQWENSVHASLVRAGNPAAPVCSNCHSPHAVTKGALETVATVPCKSCHAATFAAYAGSVHGIARSQGITAAPLCMNCHGMHDVTVPSTGAEREHVCFACHTEAIAAHGHWLTNVALHLEAVSCSVCHAPGVHAAVDLAVYNSATGKEIAQPSGISPLQQPSGSPGAQRPGLDPATLAAVLSDLDRKTGVRASVEAQLKPQSGAAAHRLVAVTLHATSDCTVCHQDGAAPFRHVAVSFVGPFGMPVSYPADPDVLTSVLTFASLRKFYVIGGTRIAALDIVVFLAFVVGIVWSLVHLSIRLVLWRRKKVPSNDGEG
jgi:hypothetical protein